MTIKSYCELSINECQKLYDFLVTQGDGLWSQGFSKTDAELRGPLFNNGRGFYSFWDAARPMGSVGCITKDIKEHGAAYIAVSSANSESLVAFGELTRHVVTYISEFRPRLVRLGISPKLAKLVPVILESGFKEIDRALILCRIKQPGVFRVDNGLLLVSLTSANGHEFRNIHNEAFKTSPNASLISEAEVQERIQNNNKNGIQYGLALDRDRSIGVFETVFKDGVGWLEALAVHPKHQGKGFGQRMLQAVIAELYQDCKVAKLTVMESNTAAKNLYLNFGFKVENTKSIWFQLDPS
jgi:ribosomal protein S18 acetylase RimI-like enzyme